MAGGMTGAVERKDARGALSDDLAGDLRALGLSLPMPGARSPVTLTGCRTPGCILFAARVEADVILEHDGAAGLAFVINGGAATDGETPRALMIVPSGRRTGLHWRAGDVVVGAAFSVARLRRHHGDQPIVGGVRDLAATDGGARAGALGRLLAFFTAEAAFGWSLLDSAAGLDYLETTLFGLLAGGLARPAAAEVEAVPAPRHLRRAEAYVRANLASELTPDELARAAGVSERSLYRAFSDFRGMSIRAYIQNARMEAARRCLMERPETPLSEVARQVGYADYTSFWRHYRSRFGDSPSAAVRNALSLA